MSLQTTFVLISKQLFLKVIGEGNNNINNNNNNKNNNNNNNNKWLPPLEPRNFFLFLDVQPFPLNLPINHFKLNLVMQPTFFFPPQK